MSNNIIVHLSLLKHMSFYNQFSVAPSYSYTQNMCERVNQKKRMNFPHMSVGVGFSRFYNNMCAMDPTHTHTHTHSPHPYN